VLGSITHSITRDKHRDAAAGSRERNPQAGLALRQWPGQASRWASSVEARQCRHAPLALGPHADRPARPPTAELN
jgi:hypothetical protein